MPILPRPSGKISTLWSRLSTSEGARGSIALTRSQMEAFYKTRRLLVVSGLQQHSRL